MIQFNRLISTLFTLHNTQLPAISNKDSNMKQPVTQVDNLDAGRHLHFHHYVSFGAIELAGCLSMGMYLEQFTLDLTKAVSGPMSFKLLNPEYRQTDILSNWAASTVQIKSIMKLE